MFPWFLPFATIFAGAWSCLQKDRIVPNPSAQSLVLVRLITLGFSLHPASYLDRLKLEHYISDHLEEGQYAKVEGCLEDTPTVRSR